MKNIWTKNEYEMKRGFESIEGTIKKYNQSDTLIKISGFSQKLFDENKSIIEIDGHIVSIWFLIFLAKEVLLHTSDSRRDIMPYEVLLDLSQTYNLLGDPIVDKDRGDAPCIFIKMTYEQAYWQFDLRYYLARTLFLFSKSYDKDFIQYREEFESNFLMNNALTIREFIILSFATWMCLSKNIGRFSPSFIIKAQIERFKDITTLDKVQTFLNIISLSDKEFRTLQLRNCMIDWREKKFEFNCLRLYPLIRKNNKDVIGPIPRLFLDRCTNGLYYDFIDIYRKKDGRPDAFFKMYGEIFEHYIGTLLRQVYKEGEELFAAGSHIRELDNKKKPDWIICENNAVILIECKSSRLPLKVIQSSNIEEFRDYFKSHYLKDGRFQFSELIKHYNLKKKSNIYSIMLINDLPTFYNHLDWYFGQEGFMDEIENQNIQFMSVDEFESLLPNLKNLKFSDIIQFKLEKSSLKKQPFGEVFKEFDGFNRNLKIDLLENIAEDFLGLE